MGVRPPVTFFGSKARSAKRIIAHFPHHVTYCDVFAGSAAVLLAKDASDVEVLNDANGDIVNLFRVLRDPSLFQQLKIIAEPTLYARAEFDLAGELAAEPVERARRFLVRQRQSRAGLGMQWGFCRADSKVNIASVVRRWQAGLERLPAVHARLQGVQIEMSDWRVIIDRYDSAETLHYLDPPYLPSVRVGSTCHADTGTFSPPNCDVCPRRSCLNSGRAYITLAGRRRRLAPDRNCHDHARRRRGPALSSVILIGPISGGTLNPSQKNITSEPCEADRALYPMS